MSIDKVKTYFKENQISNEILELDQSSATVDLAAETLGVEKKRIAKTLSFMTDQGPTVIVMAGDARVDNAAYRHFFHQKAKMLTSEEVHSLIGYDVGGVCPFALPEGVRSYLDVSLKRFPTVFPAAGSANSAVEMTPGELERFCSAFSGWIDVCRGWLETE